MEKIRENRLRCPEHVLRREETEVVRVIKEIYVERKKGRRRSKYSWEM